jgi:hypothetical protein
MKTSFSSKVTVGIIAASSVLLGSGFAQKTSIEAEIKGPDGRAAKDAVVRIERQDKAAPAVVTKTDASGRVAAKNVDAGTYRLSTTLPGGARSEQVVKAAVNRPVLVKFNMTPPAAGQAALAKKKIYVWVPSTTGTHMGGHYEEVGAPQTESGASGQNIERVNPSAIQRPMYNAAPRGGG